MEKILISLPSDLLQRMKTVIPTRKRSKVVRELINAEVKKREQKLFECARNIENDKGLNKEMAEWYITTGDGIEPETW